MTAGLKNSLLVKSAWSYEYITLAPAYDERTGRLTAPSTPKSRSSTAEREKNDIELDRDDNKIY